ncbi:hypothetical protein GMMP15_750019 [Candidatus Magnetomoraceae bacterium gMMP-15]
MCITFDSFAHYPIGATPTKNFGAIKFKAQPVPLPLLCITFDTKGPVPLLCITLIITHLTYQYL